MMVTSFERLPAVDGWRSVRPAAPKAKADDAVTVSVKRQTSGLMLTVSISAQMYAGLREPETIAVSDNTTENALMLQRHRAPLDEVFPLRAMGPKSKADRRRQIVLPAWPKMIATEGAIPAESALITWNGHPALVIRFPLGVFEPRIEPRKAS
jgi:hypothetical protein